jgi:hypothetical protein
MISNTTTLPIAIGNIGWKTLQSMLKEPEDSIFLSPNISIIYPISLTVIFGQKPHNISP